ANVLLPQLTPDVFEFTSIDGNDTTDVATDFGVVSDQVDLGFLTLAPKADTGNYDYDNYKFIAGTEGTASVTFTLQLADGPLAINLYRGVGNFLTPLASAVVPGSAPTVTLTAPVASGDEIYVEVLGTHAVQGLLTQGI